MASADGRAELQRYAFAGVTIESLLPFFTLDAERAAPDAPTIHVALADRPVEAAGQMLWRSPPDASEPFVTASRCAGELQMTFAELGTFVITSDGRSIACQPQEEVAMASIEQLLVDQVLPRALHLAGRPCLHGSAVRLADGRAVAVVGPSGSGKSTLAARLCDRGATLLCDDALALEVTPDGIVVHPAYASVRLWPDSAHAIAGGEDLPPAAPHTDKRRLARLGAFEPARLQTLWLVEPAVDLASEDVAAQEAISLLARHVHRLDPDAADAMRAEFALFTAVVARCAVKRLQLAHDFERLDQVVDRLLAAS